ncbi:hypothetical protein BGZ63DRAFT_401313 [Mariannaea sp. PMI_226]|nr:hypothetical protein BGZ63DRAFT_401313 [Mariannaea sp. PMI_226]
MDNNLATGNPTANWTGFDVQMGVPLQAADFAEPAASEVMQAEHSHQRQRSVVMAHRASIGLLNASVETDFLDLMSWIASAKMVGMCDILALTVLGIRAKGRSCGKTILGNTSWHAQMLPEVPRALMMPEDFMQGMVARWFAQLVNAEPMVAAVVFFVVRQSIISISDECTQRRSIGAWWMVVIGLGHWDSFAGKIF